MAREIVTSENREQYINEKLEKKKGRSQAKKGGEVAESNKYHYKGGQFLPSTQAEPGKWKVGKKWVTSGKELVEPGKFEHQPTPFSRSIFENIRDYTEHGEDKKLKLREGIKAYGEPITHETKTRFGVRGIQGKHEHSYGQLIDEYNKGNRWVHVEFDEPTLTNK
jgi:hypothetical protein